MFSTRIAMAMLSAVLVSTLSVAPTAAKRPLPPVPPGSEVQPGMTSEEQALSDAKVAAAEATDTYGGTGAWWLAEGLNRATANSPREPADWTWVVTPLQDSDRDGTTADELHAYVRSNVSASKMPLAISVKPHDYYSRYNLRSWPQTVASPGHWITAYGWYDSYRPGSTTARISYTDSSRDEGGATGKFSDPTLWIATMINEHTRQFVW